MTPVSVLRCGIASSQGVKWFTPFYVCILCSLRVTRNKKPLLIVVMKAFYAGISMPPWVHGLLRAILHLNG